MVLSDEPRARAAFVMAYNSIPCSPSSNWGHLPSPHLREGKEDSNHQSALDDRCRQIVMWESTMPFSFHRNASRTPPNWIRVGSAKSFAILCMLVVTWSIFLLCYWNCKATNSGPTCQRRKNIQRTSRVSLHRESYEGLHTTIKKPHRLLAHFYKGKQGLSGLPNLTQRGL